MDSLSAFPFLNTEAIEGLKSELPYYMAAAEDVSPEASQHQPAKVGQCCLSCRVALIQPSSAAAERVFSILASSFGKQQESSLEDYVQLSVMMQYNYRKSKTVSE